MGKDINNHFTNEELYVPAKCTKRCSTILGQGNANYNSMSCFLNQAHWSQFVNLSIY